MTSAGGRYPPRAPPISTSAAAARARSQPTLEGYERRFGVLVQPDGNTQRGPPASLQAPVHSTPFQFGVGLYTANGVLDPEFGSGGTVMSPIAGLNGEAAVVALQGDGKIVVAGPIYATGGENYRLGPCVTRPTAPPTWTFAMPAWPFSTSVLPLLYPTDLALQDDGMIVVAGWAENGGSPSAFAAARSTPPANRTPTSAAAVS